MKMISQLRHLHSRFTRRPTMGSGRNALISAIAALALMTVNMTAARATPIHYQISNGSFTDFLDGDHEAVSGDFTVDTSVPQATSANITLTGNTFRSGFYSFVEGLTNFNGTALSQLWVEPPNGFGPDVRLEFSGLDPLQLTVTRVVFNNNSGQNGQGVDLHPHVGLVTSILVVETPEPSTLSIMFPTLGLVSVMHRARRRERIRPRLTHALEFVASS